ncbi:helix-turn-helix transcriptional regulator [Specibacter sp. RAF43]|uniref:helix-turn-helix transcriptional regulator n=1 Tax=Specibacter sp. RAF43 TaxID=3233057 RepID=UPI003F9C7FAD
MGMIRGSLEHAGTGLSAPFCRAAELEEIKNQLRSDDCRAVFLSAEMGLGTTFLLRELAKETRGHAAVITIHGTPSLSAIPFGVLTPHLKRATAAFIVSNVDAIREILTLLEEQEVALRATLGEGGQIGSPLLIIDEADSIDQATADLAVRLVQAGRVKLVVSHRAASELVDPLPQLWDSGLVERIQLKPLTREQGHNFCVGVLGGRIMASSSWYLWSTTGGNPLLMWLVMADAHANGRLLQKGDVWIAEMSLIPRGHRLQDVVREQLRGLSSKARQALNLVALSEPVAAGTVEDIVGKGPVRELEARHLIQRPAANEGQLQLINPIYGEVIRNMVPRAKSLMLHQELVERLERDNFNPESLLRRVVWAIDSGEQVPGEKLLLAAIYACKLFQSPLALRLAALATGEEFALRARKIKARAHYNMGNYTKAAELLDGVEGQADNVTELLFGAVLHSATRSALGLAPESIAQDAQTLRSTGERLAQENPAQAGEIRMQVAERADVLEILMLSVTGKYRQLGPSIERSLGIPVRQEDPEYWYNRAILLAVDAERLSALGHPVRGRARAAQALAIPQSMGHDVFFLPEMIFGRLQTASLSAGEWDEVEHVLQSVDMDLGPVTVSFGGSASVARGMTLLRQGKIGAAFEILAAGVEALRISDPQQLLGFCTAMGFYAAAVLGKKDAAERLHRQYREGHGMFVVTAHERAFVAAGLGHLNGGGHFALVKLADVAAAAELRLAELNALSLALDFAVDSVYPRLSQVAGRVEGRWAEALAAFGQAMTEDSGAAAVSAGELLVDAQLYQHAVTAFKVAESRSTHDRQGAVAHSARVGLARANAALGLADHSPSATDGTSVRVQDSLSKRELEIARLAANGMSDKDIAARLQVSVRTVEGHLYRSYGKLGITTRSELPLVVSA